jgi:hypothetical protein
LSQWLESGEGQEGQAVHFDLKGFVVDHGPCWWPPGQKNMGILSIKTIGFLVFFFASCVSGFQKMLELKTCFSIP